LAIRCLSQLREKLHILLSLSDFFENATVAQQAALVLQRLSPSAVRPDARTGARAGADPAAIDQVLPQQIALSDPQQAIPPRDRTIPSPLSPAQRRLWFLEQLNLGLPVYNEAEAVRLHGELNVEALERALNGVIARHEILRATIQVINEQPVTI